MKRLVPIILLLMVVLMTGTVPQSVNAADNEDASVLTPQEQQFSRDLLARCDHAVRLLENYRRFMSRFKYADYAAKRLFGKDYEERWRQFKQDLNFPDCSMNSAPSTFKDIQTKWNTNICPKFAKMRLIVEREFVPGITLEGWMALGESLKDECGYIEDSLQEIRDWAAEQSRDLINQRTFSRMEVSGVKKELFPKKPVPKEGGQQPKQTDDDFCFIATAAYGTPTAVEIDELRRFRDDYLRDSYLGNEFIKFYYKNSPPIARFISEHEILRVVVREGFVEPVVKIVELTEKYWSE